MYGSRVINYPIRTTSYKIANDIFGFTGTKKVESENVLLLLIKFEYSGSILVAFYSLDLVSIVELDCTILKVLLGLE